MSVVKGEGQFIGSGMSALFLYETLESAADRGYGVIIQPVGPEQSRGFNLYQVTPSKALAYNAMYEALKELLKELNGFMDGEECDHDVGICYCDTKANIIKAEQALTQAEGK
ncbi:hypothetical protein LCGC14_1986810 [marine sediment metagenome]|uniref:Uncharacterized protein n=1 Tax=marine sediment metagenome TaxID=412755 RepID=A0A0F9I4C2_9ZZZZ